MKKLGFGLMRLPQTDADDASSIDLAQVKQMADVFMAGGFTYYDTAYVYHSGKSETAFREAVVKRYPRDSFTITDKMPMFIIKTEDQLETIFNEQLERCGVEYFDYYWLHALSKETFELAEKVHAFEFILKKKAEGKVHHVGFSFHDTADVLDTILTRHPEMEIVQLQLNYLDWKDPEVQSEKNYAVAEKHGKKVVVMEPLKGGTLAALPAEAEKILSAVSPAMPEASWGIRFAASKPAVMMVLSGMSNLAQMKENTGFMADFQPLSSAEEKAVSAATESIAKAIAIPCTKCHYCTDGCPMKIAIPEYFAIYNQYKIFGNLDKAKHRYEGKAKSRGLASACIECRQCEGVCPQHLPIVDNLKEIARTFEK